MEADGGAGGCRSADPPIAGAARFMAVRRGLTSMRPVEGASRMA